MKNQVNATKKNIRYIDAFSTSECFMSSINKSSEKLLITMAQLWRYHPIQMLLEYFTKLDPEICNEIRMYLVFTPQHVVTISPLGFQKSFRMYPIPIEIQSKPVNRVFFVAQDDKNKLFVLVKEQDLLRPHLLGHIKLTMLKETIRYGADSVKYDGFMWKHNRKSVEWFREFGEDWVLDVMCTFSSLIL